MAIQKTDAKGMPTPLNYADRRTDAEPEPRTQPTLLRVARLIGCAIVTLGGAVMVGSSVMAVRYYGAASALEAWGGIFIAGGMFGFIVEYIATFFRGK